MTHEHRPRIRRRSFAFVLLVVLLGSFVPLASVSATVTVIAATGGSAISADTNSSGGTATYTTLAGPAVQEEAPGEVPSGGNIVLTVPTGFQFNPGSASAATGGSGCAGMTLGTVTTDATTVTIPITASSLAPCRITVSGLQVRPTLGTPLASGNITNTGDRGPSGNYGTLTEVPGTPLITFTSGPIASTTGGATLAPSPAFHDEDAWGNDRAGDSVQLSVKAGTGTAGAAVTCGTNPATTSFTGDVTFSNCSVDKAGTGYVLTATAGTGSGDTNAFDITVGPPNKLIFQSYPGTTTPRQLIPQPTVIVADAGGNVETSDNATVITLAISSNAGTFTCTGGVSMTVTAGVASFANCTQTQPGTYTLTVTSSPSFTPATGPNFTIFSSEADRLAFCWGTGPGCPSTAPAISSGVVFSVQPTVRVEDQSGTTVATDNTTVVTLSIAPGSPTSGGPGTLTCTGGLSKTVTAGVANFSGCAIDTGGAGYRVNATSSPLLTAAQSNAFDVTSGPPTKLVFTVEPPATVSSGAPFPNALKVSITDASGTVITGGISASIALSIGNNPSGGTGACSGGTTVNTVNGVATFTGCALTGPGNGYTLVATAVSTTPTTTLTPATSTPINVVSTPVSDIRITTSPALNGATPPTAVIVWGHDVTFTIHFGGNAANQAFDLQVSKDQVSWSTIAPLTTNASGDATFVYGPSDNRYYRASVAGGADVPAGVSPIVRVVVRSVILLRPSNAGKPTHVKTGTLVAFIAVGRPNRPELPQGRVNYVVYALGSNGWAKVVDQVLAVSRETGKATLNLTFAGAGKYYVRAQLVPTTVNANSGWTPIVRYDVG